MRNSTPLLRDGFLGILKKIPPQQKRDWLKELIERQRRFDRTQLFRYKPRPKQAEFHAAGATHRERLFLAPNQIIGKTTAGAAEMAYHLTGLYPAWWVGRRFDTPVRGLACGVSGQSTRDVIQEKLIGPPDLRQEWGTGLIPGHLMREPSLGRGATDSVDTVSVEHAGGGLSMVQFKAYEQGRAKIQGPSREVIWLDEECPADFYVECVARTKACGGIVYITFTPERGWTQVIELYLGAGA